MTEENSRATQGKSVSERKEDPNVGHRNRLRNELLTYGITEKNEYRAIELLLFYAIPYKDTRPLARKLVNEFGSLFNILNMPREQLVKVSGVTDNVALFLGVMAKIADRYLYESMSKKAIANAGDVMKIIKRYITPGVESCFVVSVGVNDNLIRVLKVSEGMESSLEVPVREITRTILIGEAYRVIVVHNHPSGIDAPSEEDRAYTYSIGRALDGLGLEMLDHVIIHGDVAYSMRTKKSYCHMLAQDEIEEEKSLR